MTSPELLPDDPMERLFAEFCLQHGIKFKHDDAGSGLDFYLPDFNTYVEVKQFHSDRIAAQMKRADNVIAIQGMGSMKALLAMLRPALPSRNPNLDAAEAKLFGITPAPSVQGDLLAENVKAAIYDAFHNMTVPSMQGKFDTVGKMKDYVEKLVMSAISSTPAPDIRNAVLEEAAAIADHNETYWKGVSKKSLFNEEWSMGRSDEAKEIAKSIRALKSSDGKNAILLESCPIGGTKK